MSGQMNVVQTADLEIRYRETGPVDGTPVILLHGFPYDIHAYDQVADILASRTYRCFIPFLRGYGPTRFLSPETMKSGQQAALAADLIGFMDGLSLESAFLGGYDWGGRAASIVSALWPARARGLVSCGVDYNIQDIPNAGTPASAEEEARYWYMYYFHTERGRNGLIHNRRDICHYIWSRWSPNWQFDESVWEQSAPSFDNPDFVEIVLHSYQHRFGIVPGDPAFDAIERQLAKQPSIDVPTIVLLGREDEVSPPTEENQFRSLYTGYYERDIVDGVGHNFPQEAPEVFAEAIHRLATQR